ncbi:hypothetical protein L798_02259 [Zootermopsis nevadensis]|uniref:Uncharacterized protein n=1 Tax=Zootermopsis nevadensis TaxID=136037 RepID=A0A067QHP2_ZOONE|nr:hypothetical protein L798_02259 [Zootermopsis nevadensis]
MMTDEPFTYLAVAEDRQFFTTLAVQMLSQCTKNYYTVCPSDFVLRKSGHQDCLVALFYGKTDIVLHENFEPVWIRSGKTLRDQLKYCHHLQPSKHLMITHYIKCIHIAEL